MEPFESSSGNFKSYLLLPIQRKASKWNLNCWTVGQGLTYPHLPELRKRQSIIKTRVFPLHLVWGIPLCGKPDSILISVTRVVKNIQCHYNSMKKYVLRLLKWYLEIWRIKKRKDSVKPIIWILYQRPVYVHLSYVYFCGTLLQVCCWVTVKLHVFRTYMIETCLYMHQEGTYQGRFKIFLPLPRFTQRITNEITQKVPTPESLSRISYPQQKALL